MKILLILAHPDPASFSHAIALRSLEPLIRNGYQVVFHDLYTTECSVLWSRVHQTSGSNSWRKSRLQLKNIFRGERGFLSGESGD